MAYSFKIVLQMKKFKYQSRINFKVNGKVIINSTGCFADTIRLMDDPTVKRKIISAAGSHLILPSKFGSKKWGFLIPATTDGRVLFIVPWMNSTMVGTTDKMLTEPVKLFMNIS